MKGRGWLSEWKCAERLRKLRTELFTRPRHTDLLGTSAVAVWWESEAKARFKWVQKGVRGGRWQKMTILSRSVSLKGERAETPVEKGFKGGRL